METSSRSTDPTLDLAKVISRGAPENRSERERDFRPVAEAEANRIDNGERRDIIRQTDSPMAKGVTIDFRERVIAIDCGSRC